MEAGVFKKEGNYLVMPDGKKIYEKELRANPATYYTKEVLDRLDAYIQVKFGYGKSADETLDDLLEEE